MLKPGGVFKFEVWGAGSLKSRDKAGTIVGVSFKEHEVCDKLTENGFRVLSIDKRQNLPYVIYTAIRDTKDCIEPTKALVWKGDLLKT